jgi:hypothetical protein
VTTEPFSWLFAARQLKKWYLRSRGLDCIASPVLKSDANYFLTMGTSVAAKPAAYSITSSARALSMRDDCCSASYVVTARRATDFGPLFALVKAFCFYQQGKRIKIKVALETVSEQAEPALLGEIGKLLTLLWALVFERKHILKMMHHFMHEDG